MCMDRWFYGKEMRHKGQVATHEASTHYADLTLLSVSVLWMMLLDKCSSFVLVNLEPIIPKIVPNILF